MSLNDLPDNCLWKILENFHGIKQLIRLYKVCSRWSDLIAPKLNQVKYLQVMKYKKRDYVDKNISWMKYETDWRNYNLIELFPNLKIIEVLSYSHFRVVDLPRILKNNPQIKGVIGNKELSRVGYLENIEMFAARFRIKFNYKKVFRPNQLKQVRCYYFLMDDLPSFIEYFPNLKRLNLQLYNYEGYYYGKDVFYNGPNLSSLKILELRTNDLVEKCTVFHFMDFCPSLESAFIHCWTLNVCVIDESIKNYNLRDLVIEPSGRFSWPSLRRLLSKFPNLHHLGIRFMIEIDDNNLEELIKLLPELKILDLRGCKKVTHKSADFLSKYCVKEKKSIRIYYDCENEPAEWPKLHTPRESIVFGFDFMKHCFYKSFSTLPILIDE
ncbi:uncharacterized protein LOC128386280 [Panonychus citri]|uniref:uncharacterized protein LOC128386280 n=1 Tax=Panonychus citri TaxID=50023 RepID=UPI00230737A7|nr:uncharacterized protein LOC128386280 [Panonychus citri]